MPLGMRLRKRVKCTGTPANISRSRMPCRLSKEVLSSEAITDVAQRKRECASTKLQLNAAAKLAAQGLGDSSAAAERLAAARDAVAALSATEG